MTFCLSANGHLFSLDFSQGKLTVDVKWFHLGRPMESNKANHYQINESADLLEMTLQTIRYCEEIGLLNFKRRYLELPEKGTSKAKHRKQPSERRGLA